MIITQKNGRRKSLTTVEEIEDSVEHMFGVLTPDERDAINALGDELLEDDIDLNEEFESHIYREKPVSMQQFLDDPYYLGEACASIYPAIREDMISLFDRPYREFLSTGGIGVGKSYSAGIAICRILYEYSCMISPQRTFGLSSGSTLVIPLVSKNLALSRDVLLSAVNEKIKDSPYFMEKCAPDFRKDYTLFPNNVKIIIASYLSDRFLGTDLVSCVMDETNFPPRRKGQQIATGFGQQAKREHFDIVEKMYRKILRRIKSRFQKAGGGFNGMAILVSSAATVESFTERRIRERKDDPEFFVRDHTQWTVRPPESFSGEFFYVLCSTSAMKSRILREDEYDKITDEYLDENDAFVMDIPVEFRDDFEADMENALRDIAGFSTQAISQYIQRPKMIAFCTDDERKHPFESEAWVAGAPGKINWDVLSVRYERTLPGGYTEDAWRPRRNPSALRWCHIDTSISGDCTGFCVGHVDRWVEVVRTDPAGGKTTDLCPYYIIDFMLRIFPPPAEQIYMPDVRVMLYHFMARGFKFIGMSTDTYQYVEMHQQVRRKGITPRIISMDTSTEAYDELKSAFYEKRIEIYHYQPFVDEFKDLEYDRLVGKVDHPTGGSKDVSDAVAGVVLGLKKTADRMPLQGQEEKSKMPPHEDSWVTEKIPAERVDIEQVRAMRDGDSAEDFVPIFFGED